MNSDHDDSASIERQYLDLVSAKPRSNVVPASYHELQSIRAIQLLFKAMGSLSVPEMFAASGLSASYLCISNLSKLVQMSLTELADDPQGVDSADELADDYQWHAAILGVVNKLLILSDVAIECDSPLPPDVSVLGNLFAAYQRDYDKLGGEIVSRLAKWFRDNYLKCTSASEFTRLAHSAKAVHLYQGFVHKRHSTIREWATIRGVDVDKLELIAAGAQNQLRMDGRNYFSQFRLLHQVPELLGLAMERVITSDAEPSASVLSLIGRTADILVECLRPLRDLMTPGKYFAIRKGLGMTSGSKSRVLTRVILGAPMQKYLDAARLRDELRLPANEVDASIREWRELHLALPRNILGVDTRNRPDRVAGSNAEIRGVKSLIGSDEAALEAYNYFAIHEKVPKLKEDEGYRLVFGAFDDFLMNLGAEATKDCFPDVQERTGKYAAKKGKKK